jgi:hypothetical protein
MSRIRNTGFDEKGTSSRSTAPNFWRKKFSHFSTSVQLTDMLFCILHFTFFAVILQEIEVPLIQNIQKREKLSKANLKQRGK